MTVINGCDDETRLILIFNLVELCGRELLNPMVDREIKRISAESLLENTQWIGDIVGAERTECAVQYANWICNKFKHDDGDPMSKANTIAELFRLLHSELYKFYVEAKNKIDEQ